MGLKITKASDPIEVKNVVVCIHGDPGIGKTSLAFTAEKPLCLAFDKGVYRSGNRGDCVQVESWTDVARLGAADVAGYSTIVVDTAGRALDCLAGSLIAEDPKNANRNGGLSLPGFGVMKSVFRGWLMDVQAMGLDVVLVCHSKEERRGDELITRLDMQGASKDEVYKESDLMGAEYMERGKRTLNFSPTDVAFGKNPGQLPLATVPDFGAPENRKFLAGLIAQTKAALNKQSAESTKVAATLGEWAERIGKAESCADFDALTVAGKELPDDVRKNVGRMVAKAAKAKGLAYNKATGAFDLAEGKAA